MDLIVNYGKEQALNLRDDPSFSEDLLSADEFFELFDRLAISRRHQFIRELPLLTEAAEQITAVGISSENYGEYVEVAFAISDMRVYVCFLPENWVMDLLSADRQRAYDFYWKRRQMFQNR
jgi:hypothetical protein